MHDRREGLWMCNQNEWIVRKAFLAYDRGDIAQMMGLERPAIEVTSVAW